MHLAAEQVAHGGQADVRVRPHIGRARVFGRDRHRPGVVDKDPRADHAALGIGQHAPHFEAVAQVGAARGDHHFQHRVLLFKRRP